MKIKIIILSILYSVTLSAQNLIVNGDFEGTNIAEYANTLNLPDYLPRNSDVMMRCLNFRPVNSNDTHNTFTAMNDFHVTRLEWVYATNLTDAAATQKISEVKASGRYYGGTASNSGSLPNNYSCVNLNGENVTWQHMRAWVPAIGVGCMNNPNYYQHQLTGWTKVFTQGANSLQRDDAGQGKDIYTIGGCFCDYCMTNFTAWLNQNYTSDYLLSCGVTDPATFNYKNYLKSLGNVPVGDGFKNWTGGNLKALFIEFQTQTSFNFFNNLKTSIQQTLNKSLILSCNNTSYQSWVQPYSFFDYAISETIVSTATPVNIHNRANATLGLSKKQVFSTPKFLTPGELSEPARLRVNRNVIAHAYACGGLMMVPWDVYEQTPSGNDRFFGLKQDYADLYGFVRGIAPYLDGYVEAAAFGKNMTVNSNVINSTLPDSVYAVVRVIPKSITSDVVIHLIDWRSTKSPFSVSLSKTYMFAGNAFSVKLLQPVAYNETTHNVCETNAAAARPGNELFSAKQSSSYQPLVNTTTVSGSEVNQAVTFIVPQLSPWGVLVISRK
jgi:hypothetical protein